MSRRRVGRIRVGVRGGDRRGLVTYDLPQVRVQAAAEVLLREEEEARPESKEDERLDRDRRVASSSCRLEAPHSYFAWVAHFTKG